MIVGIGTDIVHIPRIEYILNKYGQRFIKKCFHSLEIDKLAILSPKARVSYLSKRFAAKEAVAKAFGSGIGKELAFQDIAIINNEKGAPLVIISAESIIAQSGFNFANYNIHLSLSDDYQSAVAFVVITRLG